MVIRLDCSRSPVCVHHHPAPPGVSKLSLNMPFTLLHRNIHSFLINLLNLTIWIKPT